MPKDQSSRMSFPDVNVTTLKILFYGDSETVFESSVNSFNYPFQLTKNEIINLLKPELLKKNNFFLPLRDRFLQLPLVCNSINDQNIKVIVLQKSTDSLIIQKGFVSIALYWQCNFEIYPFGKGTKLDDLMFRSRDPFEEVERIIRAYLKGDDIGIFINKTTPLTKEWLYENPGASIKVYLLELQGKYSSFVLSRVIPVLDFGFDIEGVELDPVSNRKRKFISEFSEHFQDLNDEMESNGTNRLTKRIKALQESRRFPENFQEVLQRTCLNLTGLSKSFKPTADLQEAGRRLIINEVVSRSGELCNLQWSVEEDIFTQQQPGSLGWGPLDFYFHEGSAISTTPLSSIAFERVEGRSASIQASSSLVIRNGSDEEEEVEQMQEELEQEEEGERISNDSIPPMKDIEANRSSTWQGLAQLAAQLYDLGCKMRADSGRNDIDLRGVLSTGRMWRYFSMAFRKQWKKPKLFFDGQVALRVIRVPEVAPNFDGASRVSGGRNKKDGRSSGLYIDEMEVNREQVEKALLAFVSAFLIADNPVFSECFAVNLFLFFHEHKLVSII